MSNQFNPKTGGRGIEWTDETRNITGGCMHDCHWEMPDAIKLAFAAVLEDHTIRSNDIDFIRAGVKPNQSFSVNAERTVYMKHVGPHVLTVTEDLPAGHIFVKMVQLARCYAKALAENGVAKPHYTNGFEHHYWRGHAVQAFTAGSTARLIFCDSMSDLFEVNVPNERVIEVLELMRKAPHHAYQSLTKAPGRLRQFIPYMPPNLWVGVSSPPDWLLKQLLTQEQQIRMLSNSLKALHQVKKEAGNLVWMSAEPVCFDLTQVIGDDHPLDWIVIGAASNGPKYYQPDRLHVVRLLEVMDRTGTPVFYKGNLRPTFKHDLGSSNLNRWREDFPSTYRSGARIRAVEERQRNCEKFEWTKSVTR